MQPQREAECLWLNTVLCCRKQHIHGLLFLSVFKVFITSLSRQTIFLHILLQVLFHITHCTCFIVSLAWVQLWVLCKRICLKQEVPLVGLIEQFSSWIEKTLQLHHTYQVLLLTNCISGFFVYAENEEQLLRTYLDPAIWHTNPI